MCFCFTARNVILCLHVISYFFTLLLFYFACLQQQVTSLQFTQMPCLGGEIKSQNDSEWDILSIAKAARGFWLIMPARVVRWLILRGVLYLLTLLGQVQPHHIALMYSIVNFTWNFLFCIQLAGDLGFLLTHRKLYIIPGQKQIIN